MTGLQRAYAAVKFQATNRLPGQSAGNTALTAAELLVADAGAALCLQQIQAVTRLVRVEEATSFADSYLENLYLRPME